MAIGRSMETEWNHKTNRQRLFPLCLGKEGIKPILLCSPDTSKLRTNFLDKQGKSG